MSRLLALAPPVAPGAELRESYTRILLLLVSLAFATWLGAGLSRLGLAAPRQPSASPPASYIRLPGADGAIESAVLITRTATSEYYAITYWSDGLHIAGFYGRPTDGGIHPAVIYNRGGHRDTAPVNCAHLAPLVEAGFVAIASQYRGGAGSEGHDEFGGRDVRDVLNLIPILQEQAEVDPERIGMMGHSRGGMTTYLALKQETLDGTHHIKAAATIGGVADLFYMAEMRPAFVRSVAASMIGVRLTAQPAPYQARSAVFWPDLVNAPLLLQQGGLDRDVPPLQSYRLAEALRRAGKTVDLRVYHAEEHSLAGEYWGYPAALAWFEQYLGRPLEEYSFASHKSSILALVDWCLKSG